MNATQSSSLMITGMCLALSAGVTSAEDKPAQPIRIGIIGVDTSHAIAFAKLFNDPKQADFLPGCHVIAAYPHGSADIPSSVSRIPANSAELQAMGIKIVDSIDELLGMVDAVLLETNDGRPHLEQARQVIAARKPMFVDKPVAASLADAGQLLSEAQQAGVPVFSSSSLRYMEGAQSARQGALGKIATCDAYSPEHREPNHPSLFWYGIHGVETLFTVMGPGCEAVTRTETENGDIIIGRWKDGRLGTFRGIRDGVPYPTVGGYGGTAFGSKGIASVGPFKGYAPLAKAIHQFFQTGVSPVDLRETLEIYAFMEAADESSRQGGKTILLKDTLQAAGLDPQLFQSPAAAAAPLNP